MIIALNLIAHSNNDDINTEGKKNDKNNILEASSIYSWHFYSLAIILKTKKIINPKQDKIEQKLKNEAPNCTDIQCKNNINTKIWETAWFL